MKFVVFNRPNSIGLSTVTEESFNNRSRRPELRKIIDRIPDITGSYFFNRKLSPELGKDGEYLVEKMDSFLKPDGICQCRTEKIIRVSTDPVRSRAFMMIGMLIDHAMLMHFNNLHSSFQKSFKFPTVVPHGCAFLYICMGCLGEKFCVITALPFFHLNILLKPLFTQEIS